VIRQLKQEGMTMLIATREMGFAREVADEVCYLQDGLGRAAQERNPGPRGLSVRVVDLREPIHRGVDALRPRL